jgi:hypothetical protein
MGWLARKHGLQTNAVTALELVTAEGELIRVDAEHEPELFWALRGGGGNFGIVTAIEFDVVEVDELYAGAYFFAFERATRCCTRGTPCGTRSRRAHVVGLAAALPAHPRRAGLRPRALLRGRDGRLPGDAAEGASLLAPLRRLGPERDTFATVPPVVLGDLAMDPLDPVPFQSTSALVDELPSAAIEAMLAAAGPGVRAWPDRLDAAAAPDGRRAGPRHAGRRCPRHAAGDISMFALGAIFDEPMREAVHGALADVDSALQPYRAGYYPNFVEEPADASAFFDPATWARLQAVKAAYDPANVFVGNHHIPPA